MSGAARLAVSRLRRSAPSVVLLGTQLLFVGHLLHDRVAEVAPCGGASMLPTLNVDDDWLLVLRPGVARAVRSVEERGWGSLLSRARDADEDDALQRRMDARMDAACGTGLRLGDVVVTLKPTEPGKAVCKRVVGLPGDVVLLDPGARASGEGWTRTGGAGRGGEGTREGWGWERHGETPEGEAAKYVTVPRGHMFVCGDNLSTSTDSRDYGPVPLGLLQGRVVARIWPTFTWFSGQLRHEGAV